MKKFAQRVLFSYMLFFLIFGTIEFFRVFTDKVESYRLYFVFIITTIATLFYWFEKKDKKEGPPFI